ncbi:hypothetical protein CR513_21116, partial [Mucuna pruriens]
MNVSNHGPLILEDTKVDWGLKSFKVLNCWFMDIGFLNFLENIYKNIKLLVEFWKVLRRYESLLDKNKINKQVNQRWRLHHKILSFDGFTSGRELDGGPNKNEKRHEAVLGKRVQEDERVPFTSIGGEENMLLITSFTKEEIRSMINFKLIKSFSVYLKFNIQKVLEEFNAKGAIPKGTNQSFVVFIPKSEFHSVWENTY